jgi:hypothetical protein
MAGLRTSAQRAFLAGLLLAGLAAGLEGQAGPVPRPSPGAGSPPTAQAPKAGSTVQPAPPQGAPNEASLGMPIFPAAQFIASYDAGRGQRYYLFGTTAPFSEVVSYYKTLLRQKGDLVFEQPPTHMFEVGNFREASMSFPPGVTVKDFTWGGSGGYLNPKPGAQPERFPTVVQIVPLGARAGR